MTRFARSLSFGAQVVGDGKTRFRAWAPDHDTLAVRIDGGAPLPLQKGDDGWFEGALHYPPGAAYRYVLPDGSEVADPAARAQAGGVSGPSLVVDPCAHEWRHPGWRGRPWSEAVVYELHVGAFGGFNGLRERLPELAALGITAIELMPIAQFPGSRNWGYDGVLPYAPATCYGSPDELKAMIDTAHGLGLMVLLDVVYNHFGPDGNVMPRLARAFFRDDLDTPWGPAIDFRRPQVREYFIDNALYWLMEYRFDGLRIDAAHAITERDWLVEMARTVRKEVETGRYVHLVLENEHNDAGLLQEGFDAQWNDDSHHVLHVLLTGEADAYYADYAADPTAGLAKWLGEGFVYQGQACGHRDGAPRGQPSSHLPTTAFVNCLQNHDQVGNRALGERLSTLADPDALRAATALLMLVPEVPMLFMGEEWNSRRPFLYFTDHHGELAEAVREGRRREFSKFPAFRDPERRERIPDPNALETFTDSIPDFECVQAPPGSTHRDWLRELLALRHHALTHRLPGTRALGAEVLGPGAVVARWRMGDGAVLTILVNLGTEVVTNPAPVSDQLLFETPAGAFETLGEGRLVPGSMLALLAPAPDGDAR